MLLLAQKPNDPATGTHLNDATTGTHPNYATTGTNPKDATTGTHTNDANTGTNLNDATTGTHPNHATTGTNLNDVTNGTHPIDATTGTNPNYATSSFSIFGFLLWDQIFFFRFSSQRLIISELWLLSIPMFLRHRSLCSYFMWFSQNNNQIMCLFIGFVNF